MSFPVTAEARTIAAERLTMGELRPDSTGWQGQGMLDRWIDPGRQANICTVSMGLRRGHRTCPTLLSGTWVCNFRYNGRFTNRRKSMKRILLAGMIAALALGPAMAQETCATKAVDKNGKPLAGAALNSFLKKCKREACEPKAVSAEGKKLSGAAKNSFMQKCERDA
jgi:hypothetical protein